MGAKTGTYHRGQRERFDCSNCGQETDAPPETERFGEELCRQCYGKGEDRRPKELNHLSGSEWAKASRSVEEYPDVRSDKQRAHGASFPQSLAEQQIKIYTKRNEVVIDPFVGVGTTLDACAKLGRQGIGIDINPEFVHMAKQDLGAKEGDKNQELIVGDSRGLSDFVAEDTCDFLLTSPPYGPLLKNVEGAFAYKWKEHSTIDEIPNPEPYTDMSGDLGNMEYSTFLENLRVCVAETMAVLKEGAYAVWVVKDFRATDEGVPLIPFHSHFIELAQTVGFTLWDIRIWDQTKHRPLVCLGYPSENFYLNLGHSYIVTLRNQ